MRTIKLKIRNIKWAMLWLEDGITTIYGYVIKRNNDFDIDSGVVELEEEYAVLRNSMSIKDIERAFSVKLEFV